MMMSPSKELYVSSVERMKTMSYGLVELVSPGPKFSTVYVTSTESPAVALAGPLIELTERSGFGTELLVQISSL